MISKFNDYLNEHLDPEQIDQDFDAFNEEELTTHIFKFIHWIKRKNISVDQVNEGTIKEFIHRMNRGKMHENKKES